MNGKINISGFCKILLTLFFSLVLSAQQSQLDNLEQLLLQHDTKDTVRVNLLIELAELNMYSDFDQVALHARNIKIISDSLGYERGKVAAMRLMAFQYIETSDLETALATVHQALERSKALGMPSEIVKSLWFIAFWYGQQGNHFKALETFHKGLKLSEEIGQNGSTIKLLSSIGLTYFYMKEYDKALHYSQKGLELAKQTEDKHRECWILANISEIYKAQQKYAQALSVIQEALALARNLGLQRLIVQSLVYSGNIKVELKYFKDALEDFQEGIALGEQINDKWYLCEGYLGLARARYELGSYAKAKMSAESALDLANANNHIQFKVGIYNVLSDIAASRGNYKLAYAHYQNHKYFSDTLVNEENLKKMEGLERKNAFEREKEHLKAEQERKAELHEAAIRQQVQKRRAMIGIVIVLLAFAFAILFTLFQKRKANRLLAEQQNNIKLRHEAVKQLGRLKHTMMEHMENDLKKNLDTVVKLDGKSFWEGLLKARQSGMQMLGRVANVLDIYKYGNLKSELRKDGHQLIAIVEDAISDVLPMAKGAVASIEKHKAKNKMLLIKNRINPEWGVRCERDLIQRVFTNLLDNAVEHSPMGGTIIIGATRVNDNTIEIALTDQGTGIDEALLANIFEYHGKNDGSFKGNGLAFCKLAVEAHGGSIYAKNNEGPGATLTFTLEFDKGFEGASKKLENGQEMVGKVVLGEADKEVLRPHLEALSKITVYEVGRFRKIMEKVTGGSSAIAEWREKLEESVRQLDGERYARLLKIEGKHE